MDLKLNARNIILVTDPGVVVEDRYGTGILEIDTREVKVQEVKDENILRIRHPPVNNDYLYMKGATRGMRVIIGRLHVYHKINVIPRLT